MADSTISQLNEVTSPLTTDVLPIVNSGETKKISLSSINNNLLITSFVQSNSSSWNNQGLASVNYVNTNFFPLSGGTISGPVRIDNNLTINGNLTATGTTTFANTVFSVTSALSVVHIGSGPAMWVGNSGTGDIASFYDIDQNLEVLHVGGGNGTFPNVGVKTSEPNKTLTVAGEISATSDITNTGKIYTTGGNSDQWNSAFNTATTYRNVSSSFVTSVNGVTGSNINVGLFANLQLFSSSGTWTKPVSARLVQLVLIGGGGGGGSGRSGAAGVVRTGGGGGAGGAYQTAMIDAGLIPATVSITVGTGGTGGSGVGGTNGNAGNPGGATSFGTFSIANGGTGGVGGTASAQSGVAGGTASGIGAGVAGGTGGATTTTDGGTGGDTMSSAPGGGGGGSVTAANARRRGGDGGICTTNGLGRAAGGLTTDATPGNGANGSSVGATVRISGQGGAGGCGQTTTAGGAGGTGGTWGAGGGGGGGCEQTFASGVGGSGANGLAVVITYF